MRVICVAGLPLAPALERGLCGVSNKFLSVSVSVSVSDIPPCHGEKSQTIFHLWMHAAVNGIPVLVGEELEEISGDLLGVELEGVVAALGEEGVVAVKRPVARVDSSLAVRDRLGQGVALRMMMQSRV